MEQKKNPANTPKQVLSITDAIAVIVGVVVGAGIFRTPSIVASATGSWATDRSTPVNALLIQGMIALCLIIAGSFARSGFQSMVDFTAPVFWFFILCTGLSLFVLRIKEPHVRRPFSVPLYPVLPIVFCFSSTYLLYSSLKFAGNGTWLGIGMLLVGMFFFLLIKKQKPT